MDRRMFTQLLTAAGLAASPRMAQAIITAQDESDDDAIPFLQRPRASWMDRIGIDLPNVLPDGVRRPRLSLIVLPEIDAGDRVTLNITARVTDLDRPLITLGDDREFRADLTRLESLGPVRLSGDPGFVIERSVQTDVALQDGATIVLGGLVQQVPRNSRDVDVPVPFLGNLPVVGNLYRRRATDSRENRLMILITARFIEVDE
ncbi:hypothetical protein [Alterinioella nitratireducens]|uniref:hypothetical protein n=1 Tax=Alterinioella nitratireducens TaxID=2735915 RepID=UPI00155808F1|nr:hypothetical protein [Alterinioella nitratireducens]NPD19682.1 hypothetical protein [Alterinioella nitratireducens]